MNVEHTFTFGYRVKLLAGLAGADVLMNDTQATVNGEQLSVNVNANGRIACPFISFETKEDGTLGNANFDPTKLSPAGFGGAIDAGVVWTPNEHLSGHQRPRCHKLDIQHPARIEGQRGIQRIGPQCRKLGRAGRAGQGSGRF